MQREGGGGLMGEAEGRTIPIDQASEVGEKELER